MREACVVLLSGGIDSATALWLVKRRCEDVYTLSINYHRRSRAEAEAARKLSERAGVAMHDEVELPFLREVEDIGGVSKRIAEEAGIPTTFIPLRNLLFYSIASYHAYTRGASRVVVGHNYEDTGLFPDVSEDFMGLFNELTRLSLPRAEVRIDSPLIGMSKKEILRLAQRIDVPLELTWSCWRPVDRHCGTCEGCQTRRQLFRELGIEDRTEYAYP